MEEEKLGQPEVETAIDGGEKLSAQQVGEPQPSLPEKFAGKSVEEIVRAYEELEKKLGEQGNQLGQLRMQNEQLMAYLQSLVSQQGQPSLSSQKPTEEIQWDWINPTKSVEKIAEMKQRELEHKLQELTYQLRAEHAMTTSQFAKSMAKQMRPDVLTPDVEQKVEALLLHGIKSRAIDPQIAADPRNWVAIGAALKAISEAPAVTTPVSPQFGEMPLTTKRRTEPERPALKVHPEVKKVIESFGFDPDKFLKELAEEKAKGEYE